MFRTFPGKLVEKVLEGVTRRTALGISDGRTDEVPQFMDYGWQVPEFAREAHADDLTGSNVVLLGSWDCERRPPHRCISKHFVEQLVCEAALLPRDSTLSQESASGERQALVRQSSQLCAKRVDLSPRARGIATTAPETFRSATIPK